MENLKLLFFKFDNYPHPCMSHHLYLKNKYPDEVIGYYNGDHVISKYRGEFIDHKCLFNSLYNFNFIPLESYGNNLLKSFINLTKEEIELLKQFYIQSK